MSEADAGSKISEINPLEIICQIVVVAKESNYIYYIIGWDGPISTMMTNLS